MSSGRSGKGLVSRRLAGLTARLFFVLSVALFLMASVIPGFGIIYVPALWTAMWISGSDMPVLLIVIFALIENLLVAFLIAIVWNRRPITPRLAATPAPSPDGGPPYALKKEKLVLCPWCRQSNPPGLMRCQWCHKEYREESRPA